MSSVRRIGLLGDLGEFQRARGLRLLVDGLVALLGFGIAGRRGGGVLRRSVVGRFGGLAPPLLAVFLGIRLLGCGRRWLGRRLGRGVPGGDVEVAGVGFATGIEAVRAHVGAGGGLSSQGGQPARPEPFAAHDIDFRAGQHDLCEPRLRNRRGTNPGQSVRLTA